ncbi:hypothetical protein [Mycoavidus sp. SF9855]|uniref:hypothetical protein n=1 Tax=Mycoavidus sp. SF9855 TaxID=2968475 RepID=UPI00211BB413|nr:hypothetical protein [Mycoavidus sp. SF9855]UUM21025.1 hypothetical protein NQD60_06010 [Mycoavidus sp. SF9855]
MNDSGEGALKGLGIFSLLRAATKLKSFLLLATFILLVDNVFLIFHQPGVFELACNDEVIIKSNLAIKIILIFVLYSLLTSFVLPIFSAIFQTIYMSVILPVGDWLYSYIYKKLNIERSYSSDNTNYVDSWMLRDEAHKTKDKYLLDLHREYETNRADIMELTMFSFYCFSMLCWNYYLGLSQKNSMSIVLERYSGDKHSVWVAIIILAGLSLYNLLIDYKSYLVYCPDLYKKIEEERRKNLNRFS